MRPFKYEVSLRVTHPDMPAERICRAVPLEPNYAATKGDKRIVPSGIERGIQPATVCLFSLGDAVSSDEGVVDFLRRFNRKLGGCRDLLREIRSTGGEIRYFIGWYSAGNTGEEFELAFLQECVDLGIEFGIDFYDSGMK